MCGFAGIVGPRGQDSPDSRQALLRVMGRRMAARGPDEETFYLDDALSLVFRRLAIVDLATGTQPIWNEDRTMFVVANGEIYNHRALRGRLGDRHRFTTASDSEVILRRLADSQRQLDARPRPHRRLSLGPRHLAPARPRPPRYPGRHH